MKNIFISSLLIILLFLYFLACFWMLNAILEYVTSGRIPSVFQAQVNRVKKKKNILNFSTVDLPQRRSDSHLNRYSKVLLRSPGFDNIYRPLPPCPVLNLAKPEPLNETAPM